MSDEKAPTLTPLEWEKYGPQKWLEKFSAFFRTHGITTVSEVEEHFSKEIFLEIMQSPYMSRYVNEEMMRHMAELVVINTREGVFSTRSDVTFLVGDPVDVLLANGQTLCLKVSNAFTQEESGPNRFEFLVSKKNALFVDRVFDIKVLRKEEGMPYSIFTRMEYDDTREYPLSMEDSNIEKLKVWLGQNAMYLSDVYYPAWFK